MNIKRYNQFQNLTIFHLNQAINLAKKQAVAKMIEEIRLANIAARNMKQEFNKK